MQRRGRAKRTSVALLAVAVLAVGLGVAARATHLLRRSELQTIDARFSIRGHEKAPANVVLVLIDDATFAELTRMHLTSEFPFPRRYDAQVIDNLRRAGASTIALDIEFAHKTDEADDNALFEALSSAHGHTVLAATQIGPHGENEVLGGPEARQEAGVRAAAVLLPFDTDGAVRRFPYAVSGLQSFAASTYEVATGRRVHRSRFEGNGTLPIDYAGPTGTYHSISFARVLAGRFPPNAFRGRTVIVGASARVLQDIHATATASDMPGPEIMANATTTLLRGIPLSRAPGWLNVLLIVLLGTVVPLGSVRTHRWRSLLDALLLATAFTVAVQVAFDSGLIVDFVYPLVTLVLATIGTFWVLYFRETIERERVHALFSRFVPREVVAEVLAKTDENLRLGGVERDATVLFSDLRGFTSWAESQPASRVIDFINHYLNEMSEAILAAGGTLIAYMGDGIMAVFGVPLEQHDHADRAVRAAREMIGPRLDAFNAWVVEQGFDHAFQMGVGLHSGTVMAGNVGSEERVEYTAVGDTTNTASRLESMTKGSGVMLFISEATRERLRAERDSLEHVGEVEIRGRTSKLSVWTLATVVMEPDEQEHRAGAAAG
jgi:adenylate cyclase